MDTRRHYLAGDIHSLAEVDKIAPRRMELPLFLQTKIQIRKNLFGIKSRLFRHMMSYDYKFRSLAAEPKQVIRALRSRPQSRCTLRKPLRVSRIDRSLVESSAAWKLPPNVYRLGDFTTQRKPMGKRGPYQCFTVERDDRTVRNHLAAKPESERCETEFYDPPPPPVNAHRGKFLKTDRFAELKIDGTPPPTKYFPQNLAVKPARSSCGRGKAQSKVIEVDPVLYYPHTTVPEREMKFNKPLITPEPGRYNIHHLTCRCHIKRCERNIFSGKIIHCGDEGRNLNRVDEEEEDEDEESESEGGEGRRKKKPLPADDMSLTRRGGGEAASNRLAREPISFRLRRSASLEDLSETPHREIRFNTMITKRNLFSTKTGRPVGFLSAAPRFGETAEKPIKLHEPHKKQTPPQKTEGKSAADGKPRARGGLTEKRLKELATPRHAQTPKCTEERIQVFTKVPPSSFKNFAEKLRLVHKVSTFSIYGLRKLRERARQQESEPAVEEDVVDDSQLSQIVVSN